MMFLTAQTLGVSRDGWFVNIVPRFLIECRPGFGDTLPRTLTGTCQYQ